MKLYTHRKLKRRRAVAGIVASVILFAMIFSIGTTYFLFVNNQNLSYNQSLVNRGNALQDRMNELFTVSSILTLSSNLGFTLQNTGNIPVSVVSVLLSDSSGNLLKVYQSPTPQTTPALPYAVNPGVTSGTIDTGYPYVSLNTYFLRVVTSRGNGQTVQYPPNVPNYVLHAQASGSLTIDMSTFKWLTPTGDTQAGNAVGGYPALSLKVSQKVVFKVTFTNTDSNNRGITLWPQSAVSVLAVKQGSSADVTQSLFYIVDSINNPLTSVTAYNSSATRPMIYVPINTPVTLYFGVDTPLGSSINSVPNLANIPFVALFTLVGQYSDKSLYGQTIPYPAGIVTGSSAIVSPLSGGNGAIVTVNCGLGCSFRPNRIAFIGWIGSTGLITTLTKTTTDVSGNINTTFTVPTAAAGYYGLVVSDYVNSVFFTFQHT